MLASLKKTHIGLLQVVRCFVWTRHGPSKRIFKKHSPNFILMHINYNHSEWMFWMYYHEFFNQLYKSENNLLKALIMFLYPNTQTINENSQISLETLKVYQQRVHIVNLTKKFKIWNMACWILKYDLTFLWLQSIIFTWEWVSIIIKMVYKKTHTHTSLYVYREIDKSRLTTPYGGCLSKLFWTHAFIC